MNLSWKSLEETENYLQKELTRKEEINHAMLESPEATSNQCVSSDTTYRRRLRSYYPTPEKDLSRTPTIEPEDVDPILSENTNYNGLATPDDDEVLSRADSEPPRSRALRVVMPESTLVTPKSCYEPFEPGIPIVSEKEAVNQLLAMHRKVSTRAGAGFIELNLDNFAVYRDDAQYSEEMLGLDQLGTRKHKKMIYFDGQLSIGSTRFFVKRVPIIDMPIGNYGILSTPTVRDMIWLRSSLSSTRKVHYKLRAPATEYRRFFNPFLWVADLAKHFVDFLKVMSENGQQVTIHHFRSIFNAWMNEIHKSSPTHAAWRQQHPSQDFRTSIVANLAFLRKEAFGILEDAENHTIWSETWTFSHFKPFESKQGSRAKNSPTVVTQYIYDCFEHLPCGEHLEALPLSRKTETLREKLIRIRHLEMPSTIHETDKTLTNSATEKIKEIKPGDTISTARDSEASGTQWRRDVPRDFNDVDRWFALVQSVKVNKKGHKVFNVIWYYRAVDTLCGLMKYPWNNELFLSDHCSCKDTAKIEEDEVLGVHQVEFGGTSTTNSEFFCRQTYVYSERKWISLRPEHRWCMHSKLADQKPPCQPGETYLVLLDENTKRSEPCEFIESVKRHGGELFRFRCLYRRREVDAMNVKARPNELIYGQEQVEVRRHSVQERCHVRFFRPGETIPTPYDRDGVGAYFYITHKETININGGVIFNPFEAGSFPASLKQGFDPNEKLPKLHGLDLFCGGGNFGRGLEDGGGIEMRWANDYDTRAIHTYMANVAATETVNPFLGSIDDMQRLAIQGKFSKMVPQIGEVDFISGGSPCPGFSLLTNDKTTPAQRKNQSLVAAFGSFVDLYRPKYGVLENVPGIVQKKSNREQDVFCQLICAIVGMGYQTHFFLLDASACGSPQRRTRVFLAFAAPGYELPRRPIHTHSHPLDTKELSLGNLPTGDAMAERLMPKCTPFDFITAEETTADLPRIYDAKPNICVPFPDHRISIGITTQLRPRISNIPMQPWGMNFAQSWFGLDRKKAGSGVLTPAERACYPPERSSSLGATKATSNAFGRQHPKRLLETTVTGQSPSDAKIGRTLHWRENRVLTIHEVRRAQGFRDHEVLLGLPKDQYRIVGNSVARETAVALGAVFREAWTASLLARESANEDSYGSGLLESEKKAHGQATGESGDGDDDAAALAIAALVTGVKRPCNTRPVDIPAPKRLRTQKVLDEIIVRR